jgi:hypothetical protein
MGGFVLISSSCIGAADALIALTVRYFRSLAEESERVKGFCQIRQEYRMSQVVRQGVASLFIQPREASLAGVFSSVQAR